MSQLVLAVGVTALVLTTLRPRVRQGAEGQRLPGRHQLYPVCFLRLTCAAMEQVALGGHKHAEKPSNIGSSGRRKGKV